MRSPSRSSSRLFRQITSLKLARYPSRGLFPIFPASFPCTAMAWAAYSIPQRAESCPSIRRGFCRSRCVRLEHRMRSASQESTPSSRCIAPACGIIAAMASRDISTGSRQRAGAFRGGNRARRLLRFRARALRAGEAPLRPVCPASIPPGRNRTRGWVSPRLAAAPNRTLRSIAHLMQRFAFARGGRKHRCRVRGVAAGVLKRFVPHGEGELDRNGGTTPLGGGEQLACRDDRGSQAERLLARENTARRLPALQAGPEQAHAFAEGPHQPANPRTTPQCLPPNPNELVRARVTFACLFSRR